MTNFQLRETGKTPLIDIGTVARIKSGQIKVYPGIDAFTTSGVRFVDGSAGEFDTVLLASGYEPHVAGLFPSTPLAVYGNGMPFDVVGTGAFAGIYFVGFDVRSPGGLLRSIGQQAMRVAEAITTAK